MRAGRRPGRPAAAHRRHLLRFLVLASLVANQSDLHEVIVRSIELAVDKRTFAWVTEKLRSEPKRTPSAATLSRHKFTFDTALMLTWRRMHEKNRGRQYHFVMADSSPQFGRDWLLIEATTIASEDVERFVDLTKQLHTISSILAQARLENTGEGQTDADDPHTQEVLQYIEAYRELSAELSGLMEVHAFPPTGIGCRRAGLLWKFHAALHAFYLDLGSWKRVKEWCSQEVVALTCDLGTESALGSLSADRWDTAGDFIPLLRTEADGQDAGVLLDFCEGDLDKVAECDLVDFDDLTEEVLVGEEKPVGAIEVAFDDSGMVGLRGGSLAARDAEADGNDEATSPDLKRRRVATLVRSAAGGMAEKCDHKHCTQEVWACCPACARRLCGGHIGVEAGLPSRCHEHGSPLSCVCTECQAARAAAQVAQGRDASQPEPPHRPPTPPAPPPEPPPQGGGLPVASSSSGSGGAAAQQRSGAATTAMELPDMPVGRWGGRRSVAADPARDGGLFFGRSLRVAGCMHILHSSRHGMSSVLKGWPLFKPMLDAVVSIVVGTMASQGAQVGLRSKTPTPTISRQLISAVLLPNIDSAKSSLVPPPIVGPSLGKTKC